VCNRRSQKERYAVAFHQKDEIGAPRLKRIRTASITIAGVALLHRIPKGKFRLGSLGINESCALAIWNAGSVDNPADTGAVSRAS
jgi:hypothetical protein